MEKSHTYICLIGNDGCGKSTLCRKLNEDPKTQLGVKYIQRSMAIDQSDQNVLMLIKQIKMIDKLTYSYAFEDDWYNFVPSVKLPDGSAVKWILLSASVETSWKRIGKRTQMTIYEHPKCLKYFNVIYQQMAYFYGFPVVNTQKNISESVAQIHSILGSKTILPAFREMKRANILQNDIEELIYNKITPQQVCKIFATKVLKDLQDTQMRYFYFPQGLKEADETLKKKMSTRWIKDHADRKWEERRIRFILDSQMGIDIDLPNNYYLHRKIEGQSKILYGIQTNDETVRKHFDNKVIILLKGTIYSHTKQHTAQIQQLSQIRAIGSMLFLEMLKRNNISHSYIIVNKQAVILSHFVQTNDLEIVFKKQNLGTDRHSFHGLSDKTNICLQNGRYDGGIYIRFDWRNPNHQYNPLPNKLINLDPYYYVVQKHLAKQTFFHKILSNPQCKPIGDKCITADLIGKYADTDKIRQFTVEAFCVFDYYAGEVGLEILDGCMMIDVNCKVIWSQINPDCLRVKSIEDRVDYDKDIWRRGGSSSKSQIIQKWGLFNKLFITYFQNHRFMHSQMSRETYTKQLYAARILQQLGQGIRPGYQYIYRNIARGKKERKVIGTIDLINGQPILVQSSIFKEKHSQGSLKQAWDYIKILPQIVIVDIDGASGKENHRNRESINNFLSRQPNNNIYAIGGGIRDIKTAKYYLRKFPQIIISSNLDLITQIDQQHRSKIIVELSVNEENQILTHARTVNTHINVIDKMRQICELGIKTVSITFNNCEGKLKGISREQLRKIMYQVPGNIRDVIIAGGISSLDDLQFLWEFQKCVPQLGSAIWKKKISIGDIYSKLALYDKNGLLPAVIRSTPNNQTSGLIYLNSEALKRTCEDRVLWRYSREHKKLMKKGETSGNVQKVVSISTDCDNDALLITVQQQNTQFCHHQTISCFHKNTIQSFSKSIQGIQRHISQSKGGYAQKVMKNPHFAINKIIEETEQLGLAQNHQRRVQQSADLVAHLLMFMNCKGISMQQVTAELEQRSRKSSCKTQMKEKQQKKAVRIGFGVGKHTVFIHNFFQQKLGIKIINSHERNRCYKIQYQFLDQKKFYSYFPELQQSNNFIILSIKPKDMIRMVEKGLIDYGVNYSNIICPYLKQQNIIVKSDPIPNLKLGLIKRRGHNVDVHKWTKGKKGVIISEYPLEVSKFMTGKGVDSDCYKLIRVSGHSQSYLNDEQFDLCDAIILTGRTLEENNLQAEAILEQQICAVLFKADQ